MQGIPHRRCAFVLDNSRVVLIQLGQLNRPLDGIFNEAKFVDQPMLFGQRGAKDLASREFV